MIARLRALATSPTAKAAVLLAAIGWATGKLMELATEQQQLHQQLTAAIADGAQELQRLTVQRLALKEEMGLVATPAPNADQVAASRARYDELFPGEYNAPTGADVDVDPHAD